MILITGASGFIGRHLTSQLLAEGVPVAALDLSPRPEEFASAGDLLLWERVDISHSERLRRSVARIRPSIIVHLAYLLPPETERDPARALQVNLNGFNNLLEMARAAGVQRVVWTSSMGVYGPSSCYPQQPVGEEAPCYPTTLYGATKVMAEALARHYSEHFGLAVLGLRANLVYGPGRVRGLGNFKIWSRDLFERAVRGEAVVVPAGDQVLDWIYVLDVVRALRLLMDVPLPQHRMFNILGDTRPVRDAVAAVRALLPEAQVELEAGAIEPEQGPPRFSGDRARAELDYRAAYSLEAGVAAYLATLHGQASERQL